MRKIKKLLALLTAAVCSSAILMSGCGNTAAGNNASSEGTGGSTSKSDAGTDETVNKFVSASGDEYYMVTFLSGFPFWKDCYRGFEEAGKMYGAKTIYAGTTEYDVNAAITAFEQIIAKKPAGIAVTCMDAEAYAPAINKAIEAGIPVVTFDSDSPTSDRITFIGTENYAAGAEAARYIGKKLSGKGKVAAATTIAQSNIKERTDGFSDTLAAEFPDIELVQVVDGGTDQVTGATAVTNLISAHKDLDYIFCAHVEICVGAQQALQESGLADKTKLVGFDSDKVTLDAIKAGTVDASISQAPWAMGYWTMNYLYFINNGLITSIDDWQEKGYPSIPETANSGSAIITKENADNFYVE